MRFGKRRTEIGQLSLFLREIMVELASDVVTSMDNEPWIKEIENEMFEEAFARIYEAERRRVLRVDRAARKKIDWFEDFYRMDWEDYSLSLAAATLRLERLEKARRSQEQLDGLVGV
jgi:hypothetical protein